MSRGGRRPEKRAPDAIEHGLGRERAGDLDGAARHYQEAMAADPKDPRPPLLLGTLAARAGRPAEAAELFARAATLAPGDAEAHARHGLALAQAGRAPDAVRALERALALRPDHHGARFNLGVLQAGLGRPEAAARAFEAVLQADPGHPGAALNLGELCRRRGDHAGAREVLARAAEAHPREAALWASLGAALGDLGRPGEAADALERALALQPGQVAARFALGVARATQGRGDDAIRAFEAVLAADPNHVPARYNLGVTQAAGGRFAAAIETYRAVLRADPDHVDAALNLGDTLRRQDRYDEALQILARAARRHPDSAPLQGGLGNIQKSIGNLAEAEAAYRAAVDLAPDDDAAWGNYLLCTLYAPDRTPEEVLALHRPWGERVTARVGAAGTRRHTNDPDPERPLKIGYLSADLCGHAVSGFIEPILAHHDPARARPTCYASVARPDAVTGRLRALCPDWRDVHGLGDAEVADHVRRDGIDLLVDLSGHTAGSRLSVLALRPAPVQATYLGYPATTGLGAVGWRLTDAWADPDGSEAHAVERLQRIEGGFCCYAPPDDAPAVGPLPALAAGQVTFGTLSNTIKMNPRVVALWAEVLNAVPDARLLLRRHAFASEAMRRRFQDAFAAHGVAPERVLCESGRDTNQGSFLATYGRIDLGLDTFPYAGHTTTCEALWMGVPTITLAGSSFAGRVGVSVLAMAGLDDLVAPDPAAFVAVAQRLAGDLPALSALREGLRDRLRAAPLLDAAGFTRRLEDAYRRMWRDWCAGRGTGPQEGP